jgi:hypothetical protein
MSRRLNGPLTVVVYREGMKHLLLAIALLAVADMGFRHGEGMRAFMGGVHGFGRAIGAWVFYGA